jgi:hypothetical protein
MFAEGNVLFFYDYVFSDGSSKPKFFLIIKDKLEEDGFLLLALPSSVDHLPTGTPSNHGCLNIPEKCICCYIIGQDVKVLNNDYIFDKPTYIYSEQLADTTIDTITSKYTEKQYTLIGKLKDDEHQKIINCMKLSRNLKNKYKKYLV